MLTKPQYLKVQVKQVRIVKSWAMQVQSSKNLFSNETNKKNSKTSSKTADKIRLG